MLSKRSGQREPITYCEGMILDGRDRYRACIEVGIETEGVQLPRSFGKLASSSLTRKSIAVILIHQRAWLRALGEHSRREKTGNEIKL
jgi:hypothetical protein